MLGNRVVGRLSGRTYLYADMGEARICMRRAGCIAEMTEGRILNKRERDGVGVRPWRRG